MVRVTKSAASRRSKRVSAGKKTTPAGFVDTVEALKKATKDESDFEEDEDQLIVFKNKRAPIPKLPPLSPTIDSEMGDIPDVMPLPLKSSDERTLIFNIPHGHSGRFVVKLDLGQMNPLSFPTQQCTLTTPDSTNRSSVARLSPEIVEPPVKKIKINHKKPKTTGPVRKAKVGFNDLPAEIRNDIYRRVFVNNKPISLHDASNFCNSAAFLRTCRRVYNEGREILYGENKFNFRANHRHRGAYFLSTWSPIGYRDIHRFLCDIGSTNISHLRKIHFLFEDQTKGSYHTHNHETLLFTDDNYVWEILSKLARFGSLQIFTVCFGGRRKIRSSETRFLEYLKDVRADEFRIHAVCDGYHHYPPLHHLDRAVAEYLFGKIQRKTPLYLTSTPPHFYNFIAKGHHSW